MSITLYSMPNCQKCELTKKQFEKNEIDFQYINIGNEDLNPKTMDEYIEWLKTEFNVSAMPFVSVDDEKLGTYHWSNFQPGKINETIKKYKEAYSK